MALIMFFFHFHPLLKYGFEKLINHCQKTMKLGIVSKLTTVNRFVPDTLHPKVTRLTIITRETTLKALIVFRNFVFILMQSILRNVVVSASFIRLKKTLFPAEVRFSWLVSQVALLSFEEEVNFSIFLKYLQMFLFPNVSAPKIRFVFKTISD